MAKPTKTPPSPQSRPTPRRVSPKQIREERRQRQVVIGVGVALGLALLAILGGLIYDQLWVPSRVVASVNTTNLTRGAYWQERRQAIAREIVQSFQLEALLAGQQFGQQFAGRIPAANQQVGQIRNTPEDEPTIANWQTRILIEQGAQDQQVSVDEGEIRQRLVTDLGSLFLPPPTSTDTLTATASLTSTEGLTATDALTATAEPTPTSNATATPEPTITGDVATSQAETIFDEIVDRYRGEIEANGQDPLLNREDFVAGLLDQYRQQVLTTKIQERLLPATEFTPDPTPKEVKARHILVLVPEDTPEDQKEAAYTAAKTKADDIYDQLQQGADFAQLASELSEDPGSKDQGGDLGFFGESSGFDADFVKAAFALKDGEISQPVRTQFGWHIIQTLERRADATENQLNVARSNRFDEWLVEQRTKATLIPPPTATPTPEPTAPPIPETTPGAETTPAAEATVAPALTATPE